MLACDSNTSILHPDTRIENQFASRTSRTMRLIAPAMSRAATRALSRLIRETLPSTFCNASRNSSARFEASCVTARDDRSGSASKMSMQVCLSSSAWMILTLSCALTSSGQNSHPVPQLTTRTNLSCSAPASVSDKCSLSQSQASATRQMFNKCRQNWQGSSTEAFSAHSTSSIEIAQLTASLSCALFDQPGGMRQGQHTM